MITKHTIEFPSHFATISSPSQTLLRGASLGSRPLPLFLKRIKVPLFRLKDLLIIIIKLESNETRKTLVIFHPFLNRENIIPTKASLKMFRVLIICEKDPYPIKIPNCEPEYSIKKH